MLPLLPLLPRDVQPMGDPWHSTVDGGLRDPPVSVSVCVPPAITVRRWDFACLSFSTTAGDRRGSIFPQTPACLPPILLSLSTITDPQLIISSPRAYLAPSVPGVGCSRAAPSQGAGRAGDVP